MGSSYQSGQLHQSAQPRLLSLGPTATKVVVLVLFAVLLLLYLAQSTQGATRQYEARSLEDSLSEAKQDRQTLDIEAVRLQSLTTVAPPQAIPNPIGSKAAADAKAEQDKKPSQPTLVPASRIEAIPEVAHN